MNNSVVREIADRLKRCILNGDKDSWSQLLMISDDVALQSMHKWFEDYFVMHQVENCEIILDNTNRHTVESEFRCFIKAEYREYDDFTADLLIKIGLDNENKIFRIVWIEQIYPSNDRDDLYWHIDLKEDAAWWESSLAREETSQNDSLPYNQLARAITRNIRFREAHIQLECAGLLTCMMSQVIPSMCRQLDLPRQNSEEKIRTIYSILRNKFNLRVTRPDRDSTWASKYLAPWYGLEEILVNHEDYEKIPVSCNAFMTTLYSLLRWSGFQASQLVQFRIINQDYLIIRSDEQKLYFISHDIFTPCNNRTIYPSGKISKVFGAEWFIDFKNNFAEANPKLIREYNYIAKNTFLPEYRLTGRERELPLADPMLSLYDFRYNVFHTSNKFCDSIYLWAKYANQTLFVSKPETYIYWSVQSNWGSICFKNEEEIYDYIKKMREMSVFPEGDRIMTADQCIRHQMGGKKDLAVFLYAALKKFLNVQGCVVFTKRYEYCVYRIQDEWVIYNIYLQKAEKSIKGDVLLAFNDANSYYPLRDKKHTDQTWYNDMIGKAIETDNIFYSV